METQKITVEEYIKRLPNDIQPLVESQPYFAFFIIASGIEFLGKCINSENDWHSRGSQSRADFTLAIDKLDALQSYRCYLESRNQFNIDIYSSLRCGLLHTMLPQSNILLMRGNSSISLDAHHKLRLCIETFFVDFSNACTEILSTKCNHLWNPKQKNSIFLFITDDCSQGYFQVSASTETITI